MGNSIFPTPYKLTPEELLLSSAATVIFKTLLDSGRRSLSVSDICEHPQYGYTASAETIANGPRFVRITDIKGGNINWDTVPYCTCNEPDNYLIKKGDILVARAGSIGKSFLVNDVPEIAVFASYMIRLRAKDGMMPNYVYWFFQSQQFWLQIESTHRGSAMSNINGKMLASLILPESSFVEQQKISEFLGVFRRRLFGEKIELPELPSPMQDVRRIVAHIESLAARVNEAQRLRGEADLESELLFASYLKATRHQLLESDFPKSKIGDIATVTSGGTPSRDNPMYWNGDIPWIKTGELIDGDIYDSEEYITEEGMKNSSARLFPPETILIALYGQGQTRGRTARLMIDATTNQACCAILPTPEILDSRFTQYWQRSLYYEMREKSHGGAQPNWNGGMIKNIEIALPPLDEQRRIVAYLDGLQAKVNALRGLQSQSQEELDALLPSILDKAFKGEL